MRELYTRQQNLFDTFSNHEKGRILQKVSDVLDALPHVLRIAEKAISHSNWGRPAFPIESIVRCTLLKKHFGMDYRTLEFMLEDCRSFRAFVRLPGNFTPKRSALQNNIRLIDENTWEKINTHIVKKMADYDIENIDKTRIDSTVIKSNIHEPSDSSLLWDCIRYLNRKIYEARDLGANIRGFKNNSKSAKSAFFKAFNEKKEKKTPYYEALLQHLSYTLNYTDACLQQAKLLKEFEPKFEKWICDIELKISLAKRIINQTKRRIFDGDSVPSSEKVVSIFEFHTDVIVKGFRNTEYGHKINIVSGERGFILACQIEQGNPSDCETFLPMLKQLKSKYNQIPKQICADGCYASTENLMDGKDMGIEDVVFTKTGRVFIDDMVDKKQNFTLLKYFRAGIESNISELKRRYKLTRSIWKGFKGFCSDVWTSVCSYNLFKVAKLLL